MSDTPSSQGPAGPPPSTWRPDDPRPASPGGIEDPSFPAGPAVPLPSDGPTPRSGRRRIPWIRGGVAIVVIAVGVGGFLFWSAGDEPNHPSAWDARVEPIVDFVEEERGLEFEHPVEVEFLSPAAYREAAIGDDEITEEDREELRDTTAMMRALGLVSGDVDLEAAMDELVDSGTLAFYDPETKTVSVRGRELTPAVRVTVAHELVHALQDQHVDLGRLEDLDGEEGEVLRAVAEGDAGRIEDAYAETLDDDEYDDYEAEQERGFEEAEQLDDTVPPVLQSLFAAPYALGPPYVSLLVDEGGNEAVDRALRNPAKSAEVLFDPKVVGQPEAEPQEVEASAPSGADELDDGTFGQLAWYLMLARRLDPKDALAATDGWGGDHYVLYRTADDETCVAVDYRADTADDLDEMHDALDEWVAAGEADDASVEVDGDELRFRACDPGAESDAVGGDGDDDDALTVAAVRAQVFTDARTSGGTVDEASCFSNGVLDEFTVEQIADPEGTDILSDEGQETLDALAESCY